MMRQLPDDNAMARAELYRGTLYLLPANEASRTFVAAVWDEVLQELGADGQDPRAAQFRFDSDEFFQRVGRLRKHIYTSQAFHEWIADLMRGLNFPAEDHAFDPARLRVITNAGHQNEAAKPMYYGHRDTWYSNPASMITWWIPLHDVTVSETFEFFPDEFDRPVANDSEIFDFDEWIADGQSKRIGWQNKDTGRTAGYPQLQESPRGRRIPFGCQAGDMLLFSAQHLHQTRPNVTGRTRFSIDFRTVHLQDDNNGHAPRNVDNRSTGSSLRQFVFPDHWKQERAGT